jgi:outer membrane receptor for ferric coprogen and ferric-rhodotorulic acid
VTKQYPIVGLCFCIATTANSSPTEFNLVSLDSPASEFITPGRMLSSYSTTPNSVTQLDTQDLMLLGIYELPDAMRLVPGMIQSKLHDSYTTIAYHGTNVSPMTTTGLFFNSTSIYQPQSGGSIGNRTPVDIQDVSTIEVIRGSSAVDYGVNSISSTINLIQNPVALSPDFRIFQQFGSGDTSKTWGEVNQSESSNFFRMRVFKEK